MKNLNWRPVNWRNSAPYVIAEMSANHNGNLNAAYTIIDAAKKAVRML